MKTIKILFTILLIGVVVTTFDSCKGDGGGDTPGETESDRVGKLLTTGTWKLGKFSLDGVQVNGSRYEGMTVTFGNGTFTTTKVEPIWPASGTWSFSSDQAKAITRSDQVVIDIESIDANNLTLSLTWSKTTLGPGRSASTAGKHTFVFGK